MSFRRSRGGNTSRLFPSYTPQCIISLLCCIFFFLGAARPASATTKTWTNGTNDGLWSSAGNWSPAGVPTSSDVAVFDATSSDNCTVDASPTIQQLTISTAYTGVVSMGAQTLTLTNGLNIQSTNTFNPGTSTIDIASAVGLFELISTQPLYNLVISSGNTVRYNLSVSSNLTVLNDFTLTSVANLGCGFACSKSILVYGNATSNDADGWNATGVVQMSGTANQQVLGSGIFTQFVVDKSSGTVSLSNFTGGFGPNSGGYCRLASTNQGTLHLGGITVDGYVFQIQGGTLSGIGTINGTLACSSSGTLSPGGSSPGCITVNGDFSMSSGSTLRVDVQGTTACSQYDQVVVNGTVTLNNPTITGGNTFQTVSPVTIIDNDDNDTVSGSFNGLSDGSTATLSGRNYTINYNASGDNDVVLTTINLPPVAECAYIEKNIASPCAPANVSITELNNGSYDPEGGPLSFSMSPSGPFEAGFYFVDLTVTDTLGASSTCTAFVVVFDTLLPVITTPCPSNIRVCGEQAITWTLPEAIDADNCTVNRYVASSNPNVSEPGDVFPVGTTTILYIFEDGSGNNSFCQFDITVLPLPDVSIAQSQLSGACQGAKLLTATVANAGLLTAPLYYSWSGTVVANTQTVQATQNGTYTLTVYDADDCFSTASVTLTVDANDPVPDVASLPDIKAECSVTVTAPTATDDCAGVITGTTTDPLSYTAQGSYTITWTYDDGNGNVVTQDQDVIIEDTTAPAPTITSLPTIHGQCSASVSAPTATDNCSGTITATTNDPTSYTAQGSYTVTWLYDDGNGNTSTQTQAVVIADTIPPVPTVAILPDITAQCSAAVTTTPTANDNCSGTVSATTTDPLSYSTQGSHTITWTYDDGNGNSSTQTQTVIVLDNTAPVPVLNSLPVITAQCSVNVSNAPTATDNCAGTITATANGSTSFNTQGMHSITWVYNDANGNTSTQTQMVIIDDTIAPVPTVAALPILRGQCSRTITTAPTATDNCAGTITATTTNPLNYTAQGSYTITWRYNDGNGNISTQTQTVIVDDTIPPVPNVSSLPVVRGQCSATAATTPTATDNCAGTITATTTNPRTYTTQGTYTITWRYNDGNGNISTQTQTVIVDDTIPPVPTVSSLPVFRRPCYATTAMISKPYATDNCNGSGCGAASIRGTTTSAQFTTAGTYTIVWTYTDANGNSSTQNQTVIVDDSIAPVPSTSSLPVINKQCSYTVGYPYPSATDNCRGNIAGSPSQTSFTTQGTHTLVWTYNDQNGNITTQNQTIIIQDTTKPTVSCRGTSNSPVSLGLNANGTLSLTASMASSMIYYATDNCGGTPSLSITSGQTTFGCNNVGQLFTIGITATDANGNSSTCSSIIRITPGSGNDDDCDGVHDVCDVCPGGNDAIDNNNDGYPDCKYPPAYANVKQSWKCGSGNKVWVWYRNNNNNYSSTCIQYSNVQSLINANQIWLGGAAYCCNAKSVVSGSEDSPYLLKDDADRILLSPNPANNRLNISLIGMDDAVKKLSITDQLGRILYSTTLAAQDDNLELDLSSSIASNGVYLVHIETPSQHISKGFVVVR